MKFVRPLTETRCVVGLSNANGFASTVEIWEGSQILLSASYDPNAEERRYRSYKHHIVARSIEELYSAYVAMVETDYSKYGVTWDFDNVFVFRDQHEDIAFKVYFDSSCGGWEIRHNDQIIMGGNKLENLFKCHLKRHLLDKFRLDVMWNTLMPAMKSLDQRWEVLDNKTYTMCIDYPNYMNLAERIYMEISIDPVEHMLVFSNNGVTLSASLEMANYEYAIQEALEKIQSANIALYGMWID